MSLQSQPRCLQQVKGIRDREAEGGESEQICKGLVFSQIEALVSQYPLVGLKQGAWVDWSEELSLTRSTVSTHVPQNAIAMLQSLLLHHRSGSPTSNSYSQAPSGSVRVMGRWHMLTHMHKLPHCGFRGSCLCSNSQPSAKHI